MSNYHGGYDDRVREAVERVGEAIRRSDGTEPHQGRTRYVKGSLCVVVAADGAIVTVLLRGRATTWDDHDVINRAC